MFDSKFHGHQSTTLRLSYEIMFCYVQKLQRSCLVPLKTINIVSYNKFSSPGRAGPGFRLDPLQSVAAAGRERNAERPECRMLSSQSGHGAECRMAWMPNAFDRVAACSKIRTFNFILIWHVLLLTVYVFISLCSGAEVINHYYPLLKVLPAKFCLLIARILSAWCLLNNNFRGS